MKKRLPPPARKRERRKLASIHISELFDRSLSESASDQKLAARYAELAWGISTRFNVRLKEKRMLFCRYCKAFMAVPGGARYRLGRGKLLRITCLKCGNTYRKSFSRNLETSPDDKWINSANERSTIKL